MISVDPTVTDRLTSVDKQIIERQHDTGQLSKYFVDFLHEQLNDMLIHCYEVVAVHPIIVILFNDQTSVDLSIKFVEQNFKTCLENFLQPIPGVRNQSLIVLFRSRSPFEYLCGKKNVFSYEKLILK